MNAASTISDLNIHNYKKVAKHVALQSATNFFSDIDGVSGCSQKMVFERLLINLFHSIFLLKYIFQKTQIVHKSMIHYCNSQ